MRNILVTLLCCMITMVGFAQQRTVSGTVFGADGTSIPGVTIVVKGTTIGTVTNTDGKFFIEAKSDDVLQFSYIGMQNIEVSAVNTTIRVEMKASDVKLDEVVAVGYGTSDSKDLTAPIVTVGADELTKRSVQNPMTALQGQVAGMNVVSAGSPGEAPSVQIRGVSTMVGSTSPLYVVDGMFMDNLDYLNPDDIESISVLKDASSAAIYGVRAASGVIVVTTKQGKKGQKPVVSYSGYFGFQNVNQRVDLANAEMYSDYQRSLDSPNDDVIQSSINRFGGYTAANGNIYPTTDVDWYNEVLESSAPIQSHNISITGGTSKVRYAFGGTFFQQEGISAGEDQFERFTLRSKVDAEVSDFLTLGSNLIVSRISKDGGSASFNKAYFMAPILPMYDDANYDAEKNPESLSDPTSIGLPGSMGHPLVKQTYLNNNHSDTYKILPTFYAELDFLKNDKLKLRSSYMQEITTNMSSDLDPIYRVSANQGSDQTYLTKSMANYSNYVFNNVLTYADVKGKHRYSAMIGMEMRENNTRRMSGSVNGVPFGDEEYNYIDLGDETTANIDDNGSTERGLSYFSRLTYAYNDKYLLTATMRMDGTSKWGKSKLGYFPSLGAGWIMSEEKFMSKASFLDYLKLRASWGVLGNETVPATAGSRTIELDGNTNSAIFGDVSYPSLSITNTYSELDWEKIHEINLGFDSRMLDNRLFLNVDWYQRRTPNMVIDYTLPNNQGTIKTNFGGMKNSGLDLALGWSDEVRNFRYSVNGTMSFLHNEVTDLNGQSYVTSDWGRRHYVGQTINSFYGYDVEGIYQSQEEIDARRADGVTPLGDPVAGDFRYRDTNEDGRIDGDDRTILGSSTPDLNYGLNVNLGYKNFEFGISFYGVSGNDILNQKRRNISANQQKNVDADLLNNAWSGTGSTNEYVSSAGLVRSRNKFNDNTSDITSFSIEDGSYFKIQNIQIAYNLPKSLLDRLNITKWRLYINADNPYNFHHYNGFTPEISSGIDNEFYPIPTTYTFGMNVTF